MAAPALYVKICGITRVEDAVAAVDAGASAIGLNFVPSSMRRIDTVTARRIVEAIAGRVEVVAVVADLASVELERMRRELAIDWFQLHGEETPEVLEAAQPNAFKAVRIGSGADVLSSRRFGGARILTDAKVEGEAGGTGSSFDWSLVRELARERALVLAGGLRPDNVAEAVARVRPFGVDVASGVESAPGIKDAVRVRSFVDNARRA